MASADFLLFVVTISNGELLTSKISPGKSVLFRLVPADFTNTDSVWLLDFAMCCTLILCTCLTATLLAAFFSGYVTIRRLAVR